MTIFDAFRSTGLTELIQDQRLKDLVVRREFRITEEYIRREFLHRLKGDTVHNVSLVFRSGYAELGAEVRKSFLPFAIPVSARFSVADVHFNPSDKRISLRLEEVKPVDSEWLKKRLVEKVPFLSYASDGILTCDLAKVPQLAHLIDYRIKGVKVSDFLTLKELNIRDGEVVGKVGIVL